MKILRYDLEDDLEIGVQTAFCQWQEQDGSYGTAYGYQASPHMRKLRRQALLDGVLPRRRRLKWVLGRSYLP
jgi:hypothetical protein